MVFALFEIAIRTRLSIIFPDIFVKYDIKIQNFTEFSEIMEKIEDWNFLVKDVTKRFGHAATLCELTAATRKTAVIRRANSPYTRGLLKSFPRFYKIGRIIPKKVDGIIFVSDIIDKEFTHHLTLDLDYVSNVNISMLKNAFPNTFDEIKQKMYRDSKLLESLD